MLLNAMTRDRIKADDVPADLQRRLFNGCGGAGGWKVPAALARLIGLESDDCRPHDVEYAIGGTAGDRLRADAALAGRMFVGALQRRPTRWPRLLVGCLATFWVLHRIGDRHWHHGEPRTVDELRATLSL